MATGWTVRGSNPGGGEIFRTCPDRPWGPPSLLYSGYRVFPGGKERPGRDTDPSPPSSTVVMKGYSYTSTPPMGRTACTEPQCLHKGALYLFLPTKSWTKCGIDSVLSTPLFLIRTVQLPHIFIYNVANTTAGLCLYGRTFTQGT
jgi:hypothetical protein